jgi:hypothetical protein
MKQALRAAYGVSLCIAVASCTGLKSRYYPGETFVIDEKKLASESIWMWGNDAYYVRRTATNTLTATTLNWDKNKGEYTASTALLVPSKLGNHTFLSIKGKELYTIYRAELSGDESVVLFSVDMNKAEQDIANGTVNARKEDKNIIVDGSKKELDAYITNNIGTLFSIDTASIARKLSEKVTAQ